LKRLLEGDKKKFEEKLREENDLNDSKMKKLIHEYENKIAEKEVEYQTQLDSLQHDLNEQITNFNLYESNAEQIILSLKQEVESLKNYLSESKENFNKLQEDNNYHLGNHLENMKKERNEFIKKIETLSSDLSAKTKENINLGLKINKLENTIKDNEEKKENIIKMYELEKKDLQEKLDLYKKKSEETSEELMIKKLEFSRENALLKQQVSDSLSFRLSSMKRKKSLFRPN
jgi:chromosome segregation ATPase